MCRLSKKMLDYEKIIFLAYFVDKKENNMTFRHSKYLLFHHDGMSRGLKTHILMVNFEVFGNNFMFFKYLCQTEV